MRFTRTEKYHMDFQHTKMMGPNSMRITEELLYNLELRPTMTALDIGCGLSLSSLLVAKEYGMRVFACDLWIDPADNFVFYKKINMEKQIIPMRIDFSKDIPFANGYFDLIASVDSFHYFGDKIDVGEKILPLLKPNGTLVLSFPVLKSDEIPQVLHDWFGEEINMMHTLEWWKERFESCADLNIIECGFCECTEQAWQDWLDCENNEFATADRKFVENGALEYMQLSKFIITKKTG